MAHIPKGALWYVAEIVLEFEIQDEPDNLVHINLTLVRADSPDEAYDRAIELGKSAEASYFNSDGQQVTTHYRGLKSLSVVHEELAHGAELLWRERTGVSSEELLSWIPPKEKLGVFAPTLE